MQFTLTAFVAMAAALTSLSAVPSSAMPPLSPCSKCTRNRCNPFQKQLDWDGPAVQKFIFNKNASQFKYSKHGQLKVTVLDEPNGHSKLSFKKINGDNGYKLTFNVTGQDDLVEIFAYDNCKYDLGPGKLTSATLYAFGKPKKGGDDNDEDDDW